MARGKSKSKKAKGGRETGGRRDIEREGRRGIKKAKRKGHYSVNWYTRKFERW